jgi:all-trans-8'-apo-beta-carotenal 15,15'-oxygenase
MNTQAALVASPMMQSEMLPCHNFSPGLEAVFPSDFPEWDGRVECASGEVPAFVRGTYYLNGPARFRIGNLRYRHWLDGDGMVSRLCFSADGVHFKNRYVQSTKAVKEQAAGRALFRTFGTSFQDSRLNRVKNGLESPVNVSVYPFGDYLLAFGEQGLPWRLDLNTLETVGQFTFGGRLNDASPMAAHPKFDTETGEMFNFGIFFSSQTPRLYFYCFGSDGLRYRKAFPLPYPCSVHDFSLSKRYAIFYLSPYLLDINNILRNGQTVMDSLRWEPDRESQLVVLDRRSGEVAASATCGNRYCLHLINSFERDGCIYVDLLEFATPIYSEYQPVPSLFQTVPAGGPVRLIVDLHSKELAQRTEIEYPKAPDFPTVDPRLATQDYEEFWMLGISGTGRDGTKFFDQLAHARWSQSQVQDVYECPPQCYLGGEPVFIGEPGSPGGVVVCQEFDARHKKSYFLLFDARQVSAGPRARIALEHVLYLGFHAVFKPAM